MYTVTTFTEALSSACACQWSCHRDQAEAGRAGHLWIDNRQLRDQMPLGEFSSRLEMSIGDRP